MRTLLSVVMTRLARRDSVLICALVAVVGGVAQAQSTSEQTLYRTRRHLDSVATSLEKNAG